ncbi:hypothetical protein BCR34DRAFT_601704 [Clohesyomyces aquaticus]|uniref:Uncharacterized protein n=1 Tax=Clohesyomyces aquaticus TaxID=1231657 RepID=A0A1Y1ZLQ2_9PLEO|nr:hypothetical protein BCR34DRAFT_601704 [Clohesyomyces aquaticus]
MSMGWADNVLLAMGPLGILTTVVSAIRVGGVRRLKALVGRTRESLFTAEQELLTSTSENVCEMWSGSDIVRQLGKPKTMDLILVENHDENISGVIGLEEAIRRGGMVEVPTNNRLDLDNYPQLQKVASHAPNLALMGETRTRD